MMKIVMKMLACMLKNVEIEELNCKNETDSEFYTGSMDRDWKSTIQECVYNESVRLRI